MNEQTLQLIQAYADKLGTTAEKLWAVLVAQAPIDAAVSLLAVVALAAITYLTARRLPAAHRKLEDANEPFPVFFFGTVAVVCGFTLLGVLCCEGPIIAAGFFNPDYWALQKLLSLK